MGETRKLGQIEATGSIFSPSLEDTLGWRCMGRTLKEEGAGLDIQIIRRKECDLLGFERSRECLL